jgi:hydrogenase maturation protease
MIFVLGIGNRLLGDDGAGPAVICQLINETGTESGVVYRDGGTIGLALLPDIEDATGFIAVDAAQLDAPPGTVRVFEGGEMEALLSRRKLSVHEAGLSDLLSAATLAGTLPSRRAVIAIQPATVAWGLTLSPAVAEAIPAACAAVSALLAKWEAQP